MSPKSFLLSSELHDYLIGHSTPIDDVARRLIEQTAALGAVAGMQAAPEQGILLTQLTRLIGARNAVEVGTFTGYSALCIARGLADGGRLLCCDVSEEWTALGRMAWEDAGVSDRIDLRIAPAIDTLRALPPDPTIDLAFIDADKGGYADYVEQVVPRLRPNGLLLLDNTLWSGAVIDAGVQDANTVAIRAVNDLVAADSRLTTVLLPISDGLTLSVRN
ncbi:MAG: O-methyltransferase [Actinomycetota bacterium]|nr:O-methyltransferase [Actinomycetota bacterium]